MRLLERLFPRKPEVLPDAIKEALQKNKEAKGQLLHKTSRAITDMTAMDHWAYSIERRQHARR